MQKYYVILDKCYVITFTCTITSLLVQALLGHYTSPNCLASMLHTDFAISELLAVNKGGRKEGVGGGSEAFAASGAEASSTGFGVSSYHQTAHCVL